jgi:hypothetical protein
MSRIAVTVTDEDQSHIRKHMNPNKQPFSKVLASIIHEVVRDDRAAHAPKLKIVGGK